MNLEAIAAQIPIPVDAGGRRHHAVCVVDDAGKHRAAFTDGLTKSAPVGPAFDMPRGALTLAALLDPAASGSHVPPSDALRHPEAMVAGSIPRSVPASRSGPETSTLGLGATADATPGSSEAPVSPPSICAGCGFPTPPGRHGQRRTSHGPTCRSRASRAAAAGRPAADAGPDARSSASPDATPSRPSVAAEAIPATI